MSDGTLLLILLVPAVLAFAFGIWAGLGYPGMYDKDAKTGKAPRESPLRWLLRGGRRPLTSEMKDEEDEEDLEIQDSSRLSFDRGRRFRR
tara:strand:- start:546 stop:815 length:270 start_codon:yes stop_codon:yes gene_type:complete